MRIRSGDVVRIRQVRPDDALALELAAGQTLRDAAAAVGIGERTASRRWSDPDFRKRVDGLMASTLLAFVGERYS